MGLWKHTFTNRLWANHKPTLCGSLHDWLFKIKKTDKVLEIGTGTGYQTAIISHLCQKIYTIEIFDKLFHQAKTNINKLKIRNVIYKLGNGTNGWGKEILFDAIIVSAASEKIPLRLLQNLKNYGSLIIPKKYPSGNQKLILIKKTSKNDFDQKELFDVKFVPLLNTNIEYWTWKNILSLLVRFKVSVSDIGYIKQQFKEISFRKSKININKKN